MKTQFVHSLSIIALSSLSPAFAQVPSEQMIVKRLTADDRLLAEYALVLEDAQSSRKMTLLCNGAMRAELTIERSIGQIERYAARDFYSFGCTELLGAMAKLGMGENALVDVRFYGAGQYPGLIIGSSSTFLVYTPAGTSAQGVFEEVRETPAPRE